MIYHEAAQYAAQLPQKRSSFHGARLLVMWNMFAELEQTEGLIQSGMVTAEETAVLDTLAAALEERICPLHDLDTLRPDGLPHDELYYVLDRYLANARRLCAPEPISLSK